MLFYVISSIFAWFIWRCVSFLVGRWRFNRCLDGVPLVEGHNWFWGLFNKVNDVGDLYRIFQEYINKTSSKWVVYWNMCFYPVLVPANPTAVQVIFSTNGIPKNRGFSGPYRMVQPWIGEGLLVSNGSKWARTRRLLTPAFHFHILKPYVDVFNEVAGVFTDKVSILSKEGRSFDIFSLVTRATLHSLLKCTLSYGDETIQQLGDQHPYVKAIQQLRFHLIKRTLNPHLYFDKVYSLTSYCKEFKSLCDYVHKFSGDIIAERRKTVEKDPSQLDKRHLDFLDILLTARDTDGTTLSDQEIRDEVDTFMFEGHDTTASAVSWAIYSMAKYPDIQDRIRSEVKETLGEKQKLSAEDLHLLTYTTCFIKESMRMYTPVPGVSRKLDHPCTIDGMDLPAGLVIDIIPHVIHHNQAVWDKPEEFRPERFLPTNIEKQHPFAFIPFAAGQRNCIGQHFAMNEIKILICTIAERFRLWTDPKKEAIPFPDVTMGAKDGLHVFAEEINNYT